MGCGCRERVRRPAVQQQQAQKVKAASSEGRSLPGSKDRYSGPRVKPREA